MASGMLLLLKRSDNVVTCPGTWSLLGEHANVDEGIVQTVIRGVEEELGFEAFNVVGDKPGKSFSAEFRPNKRRMQSFNVTIQTVTKFPLYYIRYYGPRNGNRIDRQLTYLWRVEFAEPKIQNIPLHFDHEVAAHKWISIENFSRMLLNDTQKVKKLSRQWKQEEGVKDSGPDVGDFCHQTITSLYEAGLEQLLKQT